jgi:hypothetical protein
MDQQRKHSRIEFVTDVELIIDGKSQSGRTINISQGGILLDTSPLPDFGQKLILKIELPGVNKSSEIAAIVRWNNKVQIGLQFEQLRPIEVWAINKLSRK